MRTYIYIHNLTHAHMVHVRVNIRIQPRSRKRDEWQVIESLFSYRGSSCYSDRCIWISMDFIWTEGRKNKSTPFSRARSTGTFLRNVLRDETREIWIWFAPRDVSRLLFFFSFENWLVFEEVATRGWNFNFNLTILFIGNECCNSVNLMSDRASFC